VRDWKPRCCGADFPARFIFLLQGSHVESGEGVLAVHSVARDVQFLPHASCSTLPLLSRVQQVFAGLVEPCAKKGLVNGPRNGLNSYTGLHFCAL
jgi:hypothetical protein